ncbi:hypothetical protein EUTSA_v10023827mg, partial [Eutrema salsugineum]
GLVLDEIPGMVAIVVLSRNYASSSWCLDELVEIIKCREEQKQKVTPVIYQVDPSDKKAEEVTQAWRQALEEVTSIAGYHSSKWNNEADLINNIALFVTGVLDMTPSKDFDDFIGISDRTTEINSLLILLPDEVKMFGILGPTGIDKKVLVVLDEVDSLWQLEAMAKQSGWFGRGRGPQIYEMRFPTKSEALQIFCRYAFSQKSPRDGFHELSWEISGLAGKLPLGLKVMWVDALPRLRSSLHSGIESTLRFSYNVLSDDKDKALFLYIACFFVGYKVDCVKRCLANCGLDTTKLEMHLLLQQMGREIVKKQSLDEPGKRQFLMDAEEICDLLDENTRGNQISKSAFKGMNTLQLLAVRSRSLRIPPEGLNCLPEKLRLIHWNYCLMRFWPSKFSGKFLVELVMQYSKLEKLWDGIKPLQCLKLMDLGNSRDLKEIPDLSKATSLAKLDLYGCDSLLELPSSIENGNKLIDCRLFSCSHLKELPFSIGNATNLEILSLSYYERLKELPSSIGMLINLKRLTLSGCSSLVELSSIGNLHKLQELDMSNCVKIESFPTNINLESLSRVNLSGCKRLKTFPDISTNMKYLHLKYTAIKEVPSSISSWSCLHTLEMSGSRNLREFPNVPNSIVVLELSKTGIREVPSWIENLFRLKELDMDQCEKLNTISPNIYNLENLIFLCLGIKDGDSGDDEVDDENGYARFEAVIKCDPDLRWHIVSDFDIHYILPICLPAKALTSLISLRLEIDGFKTIPDCIRRLSRLRKLDISECTELVAFPQLPSSLLSLNAENCFSLKRIASSSFRFKACILLSQGNINVVDDSDDDDEEVENSTMCVSCRVRGKQDGLVVHYGSNQHHMPAIYGYRYPEHIYTFEDSFCLNKDYPEDEEATISELVFKFIVHNKRLKVEETNVKLIVFLE